MIIHNVADATEIMSQVIEIKSLKNSYMLHVIFTVAVLQASLEIWDHVPEVRPSHSVCLITGMC